MVAGTGEAEEAKDAAALGASWGLFNGAQEPPLVHRLRTPGAAEVDPEDPDHGHDRAQQNDQETDTVSKPDHFGLEVSLGLGADIER